MRKFHQMIIGCILLTSFSAMAAGTYYDKTKALFESAELPQAEDLIGFHIGKCFLRDDPSTFRGAGLYGKIDANNTLTATASWSRNPIEYEVTNLNRLKSRQGIMLPIRLDKQSLLIDDFVSERRPLLTYEVRKKDSSLVYRLGEFLYCFTFIKR